jgi:hypothetical protein
MITSAALLIQQPDGSVYEVPLHAERMVLGRAPECDIIVEGRLISRQHATISRLGATYTLEDLDSHNGTMVNGQPLGEPWVLRDGDQIELGGVGRMTFVDGDATSTRPQAPALGVWLDRAAQEVWVDGQRLSPQLSPAQFNLIAALAARLDQVCSRAEIVAAVWPDVVDGVSDEAIDALIKRVRARLAEAPGGQRYLATLRSRGLMLHSPATAPR